MSKFDIRHNCLFGFDYIQYTKECTEMSSVDVRICVGIFGDARTLAGVPGIQKPCPESAEMLALGRGTEVLLWG